MIEVANRRDIPAPVPGARSALILLLSINLFNYIDRQVLSAVLPRMEADPTLFAPGDPDIKFKLGLLTSAFLVSYMFFSPLVGWLDGHGFKRWMILGIGVTIWSLASGFSGFASGYWILLITRCLVGIGEGAYAPVASAMIADAYPQRMRSVVLAVFNLAIPVGSALGFVIGGQVSDYFNDWRHAFWFTFLGLGLGTWCFFRKELPRASLTHANSPSYWKVLSTLVHNRSFFLCCAGMTAVTFVLGGVAAWAPTYINHREPQMALGSINTIFGGIIVVGGLLSTIFGTWLGEFLKPRVRGAYFWAIGAGAAVALPSFLGVLYLPFPYAWGFLFLTVFGLFLHVGPGNTILANVVTTEMRATAFAINILVIHALGDVISPPIIGFIADRSNLHTAFLIVSSMMLIGAVLWFWGARHLDDDTNRAMG